jgi:excisionase family DNA binding protein
MQILTIKEIAERLRVCPITVYRYCHDGILPARKVCGRWFVTESALAEFLRPAPARVT